MLARAAGLDRLADVRTEHLQLLKTMHNVGLKWAEKFLTENESLVFRIGYHSVCSNCSRAIRYVVIVLFLSS